ncbi:LysR substrate-binding domain-containing protein [Agrobacterium tumefaciens]|uniref:LysR substrate-binding domain-containing protein n=1 Tax=Rhizobium/Agrobacterium group TaxID=227290 RepID=UPI00157469B3|nr:LysR substrate-binding domain-containing protein [Agrobacterium tumefaciens]NTA83955.1 LysR family transcriptional regulator [Agrobacterium tumefaciens]
MKRGRLPLTALRSFEVAGRLRSFTLAAEELHISQAAVSRQVRELETSLQRQLFERHHRSVSLTPAGEHLLSVLTRAFDEIGGSLDDIRGDNSSSPIVVSSEPSFASAWLVRHLAHFRKERPDIDIVLDADPRLIEFRSHQATIAIRHSTVRETWARVESQRLTDVRIIPVLAPVLLEQAGSVDHPVDLLRLPLLHEETRDLWQRWFSAAGADAPVRRGTVYTDGGLVLQAALQGEGVALIDELFAKNDLDAGRLRQPFAISIPHGAYWLVARRFSELPEGAIAFTHWLKARLDTR